MKVTTTMSSSDESKVGGGVQEGGRNDEVTGSPPPSAPVVTNGTDSPRSPNDIGGSSGPRDHSGEEKDENDFSDYLWMENMEEYDQEIMRQLEEDILISHYTDLYEDSLLEDGSAGPTTASLCVVNGPILPPLGDSVDELTDVTSRFTRSMNLNTTSNSRLNPNAAEFVPKGNVSYQH